MLKENSHLLPLHKWAQTWIQARGARLPKAVIDFSQFNWLHINGVLQWWDTGFSEKTGWDDKEEGIVVCVKEKFKCILHNRMDYRPMWDFLTHAQTS